MSKTHPAPSAPENPTPERARAASRGRLLNLNLRTVEDGAKSIIRIRRWDGYMPIEARVYWPFAIHNSDQDPWFVITHLPSGCAVNGVKRKAQAVELVRRLRRTRIDWQFWSGRGDKAKAALRTLRRYVPPLVRIS